MAGKRIPSEIRGWLEDFFTSIVSRLPSELPGNDRKLVALLMKLGLEEYAFIALDDRERIKRLEGELAKLPKAAEARLTDAHQRRLARANADFETQLARLKKAHSREFERVRKRQAQELARELGKKDRYYGREIAGLQKRLSAADAEITRLKDLRQADQAAHNHVSEQQQVDISRLKEQLASRDRELDRLRPRRRRRRQGGQGEIGPITTAASAAPQPELRTARAVDVSKYERLLPSAAYSYGKMYSVTITDAVREDLGVLDFRDEAYRRKVFEGLDQIKRERTGSLGRPLEPEEQPDYGATHYRKIDGLGRMVFRYGPSPRQITIVRLEFDQQLDAEQGED